MAEVEFGKYNDDKNLSFSENMNLQPFRLLVVGAGLTGSVTAALVKHHFPTEVEINVWDKARGVGGRMTTHRPPDSKSSVDLGAQYITRFPQYAKKHER